MLIFQAFRPVTRYGDQWYLSLPAALLEGLGQTSRCSAKEGRCLGQWVVQNLSVRRSIEKQLWSIGKLRVPGV